MILPPSEYLIVQPEEAGERLDKLIAMRYAALQSRSYFQYLIEEGKVLLNGIPVKKRVKPKEGDEIEIAFVLTPELSLEPEPIPLELLFEDEEILVINKPAGLVVHPAPGHWSGTLVNALLHHCHLERNHELRPGIVHRLDKETSGLLIAAKTTFSQQKLIEQFASRQVYKEYLAICLGNPGKHTLEGNIGRDPKDRKRMALVQQGGKEAITLCKTLAFNQKLSLVQLNLKTGRTHQIRVHLKEWGTPILGDSTYGSNSANQHYRAKRQLLHAHLIRFKHPKTGETLSFRADPPSDFQQMARKLSTF